MGCFLNNQSSQKTAQNARKPWGAVVLYELPTSFLEEVDYKIQEKKFKFFTVWSSCRVGTGTCIWGTILYDGTICSQNFHMDWGYSLGVAPFSNIGKWRFMFIGIPTKSTKDVIFLVVFGILGVGAPSHKVSEYKAGIYGSAAARRTLSKWSASGMDIAARLYVNLRVAKHKSYQVIQFLTFFIA